MRIRSPIDLGLIIRERRRKLGLDQRELATRVGVSRQWLIEVEKGKPRAELGLVLRTLNALGLTLDLAAGESGDAPAAPRPRRMRRKGSGQPGTRKPPPLFAVDLGAVIERARSKR